MIDHKIIDNEKDYNELKLFYLFSRSKTIKIIKNDDFWIRNKIFKPFRIILLTSTAFFFTSHPVFAQTTEWIGTTSDWYTNSNWSGGSVPSFLNDVLINAQNNPAIVVPISGDSATIEVQTLVVGDGTGSNGHLVIDASAPDSYISISTDSAAGGLDGVTIGKGGGTGIWDIKLSGDPITPDTNGNSIYLSDNIIIGTGTGSNGTLNVLSGGKNIGAVGGYPSVSRLHSQSAFVGQQGGTGVANVIDASWAIGIAIGDTDHLGLYIGDGVGSNGTVNVLAGGKIGVGSYGADIQNYDGGSLGFVIGRDGGLGALNVSGSNSVGASIANTGVGLTIGDGAGSIGNLNILAGGKVSSFDATYFGGSIPDEAIVNHIGVDGGTGTILVSGAESTLLITGKSRFPQVDGVIATADLYVGVSGNGSLTIGDGGLVHIGTAMFKADDEDDSEPHRLAPLNANGIVYLARDAGSVGTVNYGTAAGAAPAAVGALNAAGIVFGAGTGAVVFNHTDTNLQYAMPLSGEGQINVHNGTTWINNDNSAGFTNIRQEYDVDNDEIIDVTQIFTAGFSGQTNLYGGTLGLNNNFAAGSSDIYGRGNATLAYGAETGSGATDGVVIANTITVEPYVTLALAAATDIAAVQAGAISGAGNINKTGAGTLTLTADNSIGGEVKVSQGILALSGSGEVSQAKRVVADAVFDITAADDGAIIRSLAGSGTTELGDKTLTITAANDLFSGVIQGGGGLTISGGIQSLSGANSYSGATTVSGGVLRAAAINTFSPSSIYSVAAGAVLDLNDFNQSLLGLTNAGIVRFGEAPGTMLTVNQYTGAAGTLLFNTTLNDDSSASDRLMIDGGTATGTSNIRVMNVGGLGAQTTSDGILLVGVLNGGTTEAGAFSLSGRAIAGPYEYSLWRGGLNGANSDQWYLRSVLDCDLQPNAEICDLTNPPEYREEVSLYSTLSSLALKYGSATVDSLHERMGITRMSGGADENMGWGRVIGLSGKKDADGLGIYGNNGPAYDYNIFAMQAGIDFYRAENTQGSLTQAGIHAAFGRTTADVDHFNGNYAGRAELNAWSLGLYLTHQASAGWYVDSIVQGTYYDADVGSAGRQSLSTNGYGFVASIETGYPFQLQDNWTLEPQAQLAYQIVNLDDANDGAASVQFSKAESLQGRIGLKLAKNWAIDDESPSRKTGLWLRGSVLNEFLGKPKTAFSSQDGYISFRDDISGAYGQITAGVSYDVTRHATIYGTLGYQARFDGDDKAFNGKLGLKAAF